MNAKKILVIEDNPVNLELTVDLLELAGHVVLKADTAERGIQLARSVRPDLILMDISLPCMDGLAATKALKQHPATRDLPVIALTAHAMKGDEEKALAAGCEGYLTKPIETRTFARNVALFIEAAEERARTREAA